MKIWQRYLFFRLLKSFLFMLVTIFTIFVILDLATRSGKFLGDHFLPRYETILYYFYQFSNYLGLFFPLSLILSSIQVLLDLNSHNELAALQMGGLSCKKLLAPFFTLAALLFTISLANQQWVVPIALASASEYTAAYSSHKKNQIREHVQTLILKDGTVLVFQSFDEKKGELFDVFWIQNPSRIWHMKFLEVNPPTGRYVDCFERISQQLEKTSSFDAFPFPQIQIDEESVFKPFIPYERRTLSQLFFQAIAGTGERQSLLSHLFYKLSYPLFLFLSMIVIAPICFRFSRDKSAFKIVAFALFGFLAMMMILDGLLILGENQVVPALLAFGAPLLIVLAFSYHPFKKL